MGWGGERSGGDAAITISLRPMIFFFCLLSVWIIYVAFVTGLYTNVFSAASWSLSSTVSQLPIGNKIT